MFRLVLSALPERAVQSLSAVYFKANAWYSVGSDKFHSTQTTVDHSTMKIQVLPALSDNYMYLLMDEKSKEAAIVDPVDPKTVLEAVKAAGASLTTVLTTHHHWDHAGGNKELVSSYGQPLKVVGGDERVDGLTQLVGHGDTLTLGDLKVECLFTPCHTKGHICYSVTSDDPEHKPAVFTGDTLFIGGCGKFFEGDGKQMHHALIEVLGVLPDHTLVYCGHEYAIQNLKFGSHIEPNNTAIQEKMDWVKKQRDKNLPSVPSSIGEEKQINPFMRVGEASVQEHVKTSDPVETMTAVRALKDSWRAPKL